MRLQGRLNVAEHLRMGGRVVEGTGLENQQGCKLLVGSNPTPSARQCLYYRRKPRFNHQHRISLYLNYTHSLVLTSPFALPNDILKCIVNPIAAKSAISVDGTRYRRTGDRGRCHKRALPPAARRGGSDLDLPTPGRRQADQADAGALRGDEP